MYIKDLHVDVELDSAALAAIRGGILTMPVESPDCYTGGCSHPSFPTFGGDWEKFNADVKGYIGDVKAGAGFPGYEMQNPGEVIGGGQPVMNLPGNVNL